MCAGTHVHFTHCGANSDRSGQAREEDVASMYGYTHTLVLHEQTAI